MSNKPSYPPDTNMPVLFVDSIATNRRSDEIHLLILEVKLPEGFQEQARLMIKTEDLRNILDLLCEQSDYYPVKPPDKKKTSKKKSIKSK